MALLRFLPLFRCSLGRLPVELVGSQASPRFGASAGRQGFLLPLRLMAPVLAEQLVAQGPMN